MAAFKEYLTPVCMKRMHAARSSQDDKIPKKKMRVENVKSAPFINTFISSDIPRIIEERKKTPKTAPMYVDFADFFDGVIKDMKIIFPSCKDNKETLLRWISVGLGDSA